MSKLRALPKTTEPRTYVILPDQQIPWHDRELHEVALRVLSDLRPTGVVLSGDITDKPQFSLKYPWNHRMFNDPVSSVRNHQRTAREVLRDYVEAAGSEDNWIVPGNHDDRFINYVAAKAPLLLAIEDVDGDNLISLDRYLDATNAGYRMATDPSGMASYPAAHVALSPLLAVYHGWLLGNGEGGASAAAHLKYLNHSVIVGHTHRQAKIHRTLHTLGSENMVVLVGIEAGTLALVSGGLGHTVNPNWQQGLAVVKIFPNGEFTADTAVYANKSLFYQGQRWTYTRRGIMHAA
jgi:hypothetical protein